MASLGKRGAIYYVIWRDQSGMVRKRSTGCRDLTAAKKALKEFEQELALDRKDPFSKWRRIPLTQHANDYHEFQLAKGTTQKQADQVRSRITRVLLKAGIKLTTDLTVSKVVTTIDRLRKQPQSPKRKEETYPPINNQTKCFYAKAMKQLTSWMLREGRIERDPLVHLPMWNVQVDVRHPRRSLNDEEFSLLERAAIKSGKLIEGMTGLQRAFLYRMARTTGLRRGELASLTEASFLLDEPPRLIVSAAYSKHREADTVFLHPEMVETIKVEVSSLQPGEPLFPLLAQRKTADMIKEDLEAAGLPYQDEIGEFADFHALRHTFVTKAWDSGADAPTVMKLARHKDIKTTMRYTHQDESAQLAAIRAMKPPKKKSG